jgi:hypothetical protein
MDAPTNPPPVIRVETDKIPQPLADRLGRFAFLATKAWLKDMQKGGNDGINGNQANRP